MIIHETYECEYCGQVFDDETDCENHELFCQYEQEKKQNKNFLVKLFNKNGKEVPLNESISLEDVRALEVETEAAINWLIRLYDQKGYCSPWDSTWNSLEREDGFYYFDNETGAWLMPDALIAKWTTVKEFFGIE